MLLLAAQKCPNHESLDNRKIVAHSRRMKTTHAALFALACFLVVGVLEREWQQPNPVGRKVTSVRPTVAEARAAYLESAAAGLSMPCTWISKTGALETIKPRCVNADLREREWKKK